MSTVERKYYIVEASATQTAQERFDAMTKDANSFYKVGDNLYLGTTCFIPTTYVRGDEDFPGGDGAYEIAEGRLVLGNSSDSASSPRYYGLYIGDSGNIYLREEGDNHLAIYAAGNIELKSDVEISHNLNCQNGGLILPVNPTTTPTTNGSIWITT